ncbi:MAG TPA: protein kinase [Thermoanaerobaculia bacterium]|nr:protein kinase [Thermoanaerobaculia bacterium]
MGTIRETLGHYEVLGPIGAGGMGEVFVARDPKLGRKVAIKMLPARLTTERDTLSRFTQEARSASALNHPNIVTIHEVGADEGTPFIVMEYIDGRDLRSLIQEGAVPIRTVLDIATQIADGLAAAHERGIVHRDLKPENIMVTRDGFVKILDFGLAKIMSPVGNTGENTLQMDMPGTNPGTILGTVGYMSPEQATGRRLDFRSDQFALGAILHELVTGKPAFEGETAIDTLSAILHAEPEPVTRKNVRAPAQLADIIGRLLEKAADDRYASPRDLARELRMLRDRVVAEESGFHQMPAPSSQKRPIAIAIVAALGLAVFVGGLVFLSRDRVGAPPATSTTAAATQPKKYLAVLRFQDLTGDPNGQLVVDGFAETLTARLAHFQTVQVIRPSASDPAAGDPKKVAKALGANLVLTGSMMRNGDRIRVTYSVMDPTTGREWRDLIEGATSDLFGVQDNVADSVARNLSLGTAPVRPMLDPAVSQRRYLEALGHLRRYDSEDSLNAAIEILNQLGSSPSVQAALARAYLHKFQITRQPELAASASEAAERALQSDPQSLDVNVTLGELRRQTGRHKEAIDAFVRVLSQQPNNADAVLGLAETYKAAGDLKNAEMSYKRAIALQPNYWGGYNKLGFFYYTQSRYDDAIPQFQKVVDLVPDNERGYNNLGGMYQRVGRYDEAIRIFQQSIQRKPSGQGYSNLGTAYYFRGRYADAAAAFEKAVELTPHDFVYWRNLGDAYRWTPGQSAKSKRAYERAIELCEDATRVNPGDARAHLHAASALAKLGRTREARNGIIRALELDPKFASAAYEAAVIANLSNDADETAARIEQALRLGFNPDDIMRDPEFANLQKSGRLQAIIAGFRSNPDQQ